MSFAGNTVVPVNTPAAPLPYDLQLIQLQRQKALAEALRQQAADPIQVQAGGGAPAPISWGSILARGLQGIGAGMKERAVNDQLNQIATQDRASADDLIRTLTPQPGVSAAAVAPQIAALNATAPNVQGAPSPVPQSAAVPIPAVAAGAPQVQAPDMNAQLAAVLAARGGPQTQMIQQAMLPQLLNRQNMEIQRENNRQDKLWENQLPISVAAQQTMDAQGKMARDNALFNNQLPMTAAERAANAVQLGTLAETRRYHNQMSGSGLSADGSPNPAVLAWKQAITRGDATMANVPAPLKNPVALAMAGTDKTEYTPTASRKLTLAASQLTKPYTDMAAYKLTADGLPYLQRIAAASQHPGSVSDQDLLDSLTKLNTGGNAVTEAQVNLITGDGSLSDWAGQMSNSLKNGGALSDNQRQQIRDIASDIFANYRKGYAPVYQEATAKLRAAGIPEPFWTIPDLNKLNAGQADILKGGSGGGWGTASVVGGK